MFLSVETYGFIDVFLSNCSCLPSGLLSSGHNIVVHIWQIQTTHMYLYIFTIHNLIQSSSYMQHFQLFLQEQEKTNLSQSKQNDSVAKAPLCLLQTLCSHMIGKMLWLYTGFTGSLPRLPLSEGKAGLDLELCAYNEDKRDSRGDFASTVWRRRWEGTKGKAPKQQTVADGTYPGHNPASIMLWLAPSSLKSVFA